MTTEQYLQRAELCFALEQNMRSAAHRRENMMRASWLWLFAWVGMFE